MEARQSGGRHASALHFTNIFYAQALMQLKAYHMH
jgi:hypothetical protein